MRGRSLPLGCWNLPARNHIRSVLVRRHSGIAAGWWPGSRTPAELRRRRQGGKSSRWCWRAPQGWHWAAGNVAAAGRRGAPAASAGSYGVASLGQLRAAGLRRPWLLCWRWAACLAVERRPEVLVRALIRYRCCLASWRSSAVAGARVLGELDNADTLRDVSGGGRAGVAGWPWPAPALCRERDLAAQLAASATEVAVLSDGPIADLLAGHRATSVIQRCPASAGARRGHRCRDRGREPLP